MSILTRHRWEDGCFFPFCSQNNSFSGIENNIELNISLGEQTPGTHKELSLGREEGNFKDGQGGPSQKIIHTHGKEIIKFREANWIKLKSHPLAPDSELINILTFALSAYIGIVSICPCICICVFTYNFSFTKQHSVHVSQLAFKKSNISWQSFPVNMY